MAMYFLVLLILFPLRPPEQSRGAPAKVKTSSAGKTRTILFCELVGTILVQTLSWADHQ